MLHHSKMPSKYTLLSLDMGQDDCLYRFLREDSSQKRIVYVHLKYLDLIPETSQTFGPEVIRELSKLKEWSSEWETLVISQNHVEQNTFKRHSLPPQNILGNYPYFNIFDITVVDSMTNRVFCVMQDKKECFMKIARFEYELGWLAQEIKAYHTLACHDSFLGPRLLGYVYEESQDRVVGFLYEKITGYWPGIGELEVCENALRELHKLDILHGDPNRYNMFVTEKGVKFIDFEDSRVGKAKDADADYWEKAKSDEERSLREWLADESGRGRPI
ncbi:hypothetical protein PENDEC_c014G03927 [Penicillium decumbens]|uniref:Aminoglycoside phosphotransferase domain-containing protein n=1 Tax=Penicillium decumbens TaxID=69771 RepID=A0A1V6P9F9_PENDC|nr:hypothetical protein PENDEC_c014G03927 [Penicillium decumbens]